MPAANYIHFHPDLLLEVDSLSRWRIKRAKEALWLQTCGADQVETLRGVPPPRIQGWHSAEFGLKHPNTVLVLRKTGGAFFAFGYVVSRSSPVEMTVLCDQCAKTSEWTLQCKGQSWIVSTDVRKRVLLRQ